MTNFRYPDSTGPSYSSIVRVQQYVPVFNLILCYHFIHLCQQQLSMKASNKHSKFHICDKHLCYKLYFFVVYMVFFCYIILFLKQQHNFVSGYSVWSMFDTFVHAKSYAVNVICNIRPLYIKKFNN